MNNEYMYLHIFNPNTKVFQAVPKVGQNERVISEESKFPH